MLAWMSQADELLSRRDLADKALAEPGVPELPNSPSDSSTAPVADAAFTQSKSELLVLEFEKLTAPDGPRATVTGWLQRTPSDTQLAESWQLADQSISSDDNGLVVTHREGLCPIGKNQKRVLPGGGFDGQMSYCRSADRYAEYPAPENAHRTFGVRPSRPALLPETSAAPTTNKP